MKKNIILLIIFLSLTCCLWGYNYFSPVVRTLLTSVAEDSLSVDLKESPLITGSVSISLQSGALLDSSLYNVDHYQGIITFSSGYDHLKIDYAVFPEDLRKKYFNYAPAEITGSDTQIYPLKKTEQEYEPLNLLVKGNKTVSISVTEGQDFTIDQNLYLRISGEMSDDINIQAQVSDSQSPITPEGDSRQISNLDKIFIRIYGKHYELGLGDLQHKFSDSRFLAYTTYFEGVKFSWDKSSSITGAAAISRSQNAVVNITGVDGKQGPYWLSNDYGGEALIVPGSETVYLNGNKMQRGDDYSIDYSQGSITFKAIHFIDSSDKIYAVYQYSDEYYRQNVYLMEGRWQISDRLSAGSAVYSRSDDADNPLSVEFNDSDLDSLAQAGDKQVAGSGIYETEEGLGEYVLTDEGWYQYVGLDSTGIYNINFHLQTGGDYIVSDNGLYYIYNGAGNGDYMPGVELTAPQDQKNFSFWSHYDYQNLSAAAELLVSSNDLNTLSDKDDDDNTGWALLSEIKYRSSQGYIEPDITVGWQQNSADLYTFTPLSSALDSYETSLLPDTLDQQQIYLNSSVVVNSFITPFFNLRRTTAGKEYQQDYLLTGFNFLQKSYLPKCSYRLLQWENDYDELQEDMISHEADVGYTLGLWSVGSNIKRKSAHYFAGDYSLESDYAFLSWEKDKAFSTIYYQIIRSDSLEQEITRESQTTGWKGKFAGAKHQITFDFAHRIVTDSASTAYDLADISLKSRPSNMLSISAQYSLRNLDFYPKIRELVYIGYQEGNYDEDGLEDPDGDYDWEITAIDYSSPQRSIELASSATVNINPATSFSGILSKWRFEANGSINEQSTTEQRWKLYLLDPDQLMQPEKSIYALQSCKLRFWYDFIKNTLSLRLTSDNQNRLDNRYQDSEEVDIDRLELYLRYKYSQAIGWEWFIEKRTEIDSRYDSKAESYDFAWETRYKPHNKINYSFRVEYGIEDGNSFDDQYDYSLSKVELINTVSWYPKRSSRFYARIKYRHNDREGDDSDSWLQEKRKGDVAIWNISYKYKVNSFIDLIAEYSGDKYPQQEDSHEISVEVSAEF